MVLMDLVAGGDLMMGECIYDLEDVNEAIAILVDYQQWLQDLSMVLTYVV